MVETSPTSEPDALYVLTCLLVGGTVEVMDVLLARARLWRANVAAEPKLLPAPSNETDSDRLRYLLIGLLIESERHLRDQTFRLGNLLLYSADLATSMARPALRSWLLAPVRPWILSLVRRGETERERLIHQGRLEEAVSRLLTREITDEVMELVLAYLGNKPEVRRLIQDQGTSLAGEVVDEVRDRSKAADTRIETLIHGLFNRVPRTPSSPPAQ
jgi:hypothetical protein